MNRVARGIIISGSEEPAGAAAFADALSDDPPDRRSSERHRVIFRTAKLLLEGHDSFCIMRDISSTGMKLQVFGPMDAVDVVEIEFLGGRTLRMHKRWSRADQCGFAFETPIAIADTIALPSREYDRRAQRLRLDVPAAIQTADGAVIQVRLRDISLAGAGIMLEPRLKTWSELRIGIDGIGRKKASVRWWRQDFAGLHFRTPIGFNALAAWSAQLSGDPPPG